MLVSVIALVSLIERIIAQSERRVLAAETVPASEKLVNLFGPHDG